MSIIKYTVYGIQNIVNGKYYIGVTKDLNSRWSHHKSQLRHNRHPNNLIQDDYNIYGENVFKFVVIEELDCDISTMAKKEIYYIDKYNSFLNGYNRTYGGDGTIYRKLTDEQRKKMSDDMIGNTYALGTKHSAETCHNQSVAMKNCHDIKERKHRGSITLHKLWNTKKFRDKMLALNIGNTYSLGKHMSEEAKLKLSSKRIGDANPFFGKSHTESTKKLLSSISKKRWENPEYRRKVIENTKLGRTASSIAKLKHSLKLVKHTYGLYDVMIIRYRHLCGESHNSIHNDYNKLSMSGMKKICYCTTYKYLPNNKEELYNKIINYQSDEKLLEGLETRQVV